LLQEFVRNALAVFGLVANPYLVEPAAKLDDFLLVAFGTNELVSFGVLLAVEVKLFYVVLQAEVLYVL